MAGRRDPAKERFWRETMRRWQGSGLTVRVFCNRFALSEASFYAWRRVLTQRDRGAGRGSNQSGAKSRMATSRAPARFLPVRVIADAATSASPAPGIEVRLASGTVIHIPRGVDRQTLADVISVLEQRPC